MSGPKEPSIGNGALNKIKNRKKIAIVSFFLFLNMNTKNNMTTNIDQSFVETAGLKALLHHYKQSQLEYVQCGMIDSFAGGE